VVGTLIVTLSRDTIDPADPSDEVDRANRLTDNIRKAMIILILVIALLIALTFFIRIQKRRKAFLNRKRTKIL
jgi:hypothetical protein